MPSSAFTSTCDRQLVPISVWGPLSLGPNVLSGTMGDVQLRCSANWKGWWLTLPTGGPQPMRMRGRVQIGQFLHSFVGKCRQLSSVVPQRVPRRMEPQVPTAATSSYSLLFVLIFFCLPVGSEGKLFACNVGDLGSIPGSGRSPGEGNGNPLQYACLENPMNGGTW